MIRVENILYATDFSPYSNQAYFHAVALAERHEATLTVAHVFTPPPLVVPGGDGIIAPILAENGDERERRREQLQQIRPLNPNIPVQHVLLIGDPAEQILGHAAAAQMDVIVLGTHGRTGLERLLMGSVAEKVLRGATCSVLVVKMPKPAPAEDKK